jgi:hypothetical protein
VKIRQLFVAGLSAARGCVNLETMIVLDRGDLELNFGSDLYVN